MSQRKVCTAVAIACLAFALAACASQSSSVTSTSLETETQRQTAALTSEADTEIGECVAQSATAAAHEPSEAEAKPGDIADEALSQCGYLLNEYESDDGALVLATDPTDGLSFATRHAEQRKADMSQSARRHAIAIVMEERAKLAQQ